MLSWKHWTGSGRQSQVVLHVRPYKSGVIIKIDTWWFWFLIDIQALNNVDFSDFILASYITMQDGIYYFRFINGLL